MRYGIISDIHSNLEALHSVLNALSGQAIDRYVCVGDIVGYGADPVACVNLIRRLDPIIVIGNHDAACVGKADVFNFNAKARTAVEWTGTALDEQSLAYLETLKYIENDGKLFTLVHGTLHEPEVFSYMISIDQAQDSFGRLESAILFVGHTHVPGVFELRNGRIRYSYMNKMRLASNARYIVNAGSVGQPRDGDNRACYVVYDTVRRSVDIERVDYDIKTAERKILEAGLPEMLAYRLESGM
ncbi:MAG: metallophosphoesterase family protein [Candidatus Omnitrophota bacterium]